MQSFMGPNEPANYVVKMNRQATIDMLMAAMATAVTGSPEEVMGLIAKSHDAAEQWRNVRNKYEEPAQ